MFSLIFTPLLTALAAHAMVSPTSPDSSTVVKVGGQITALWTADTTGTWTDVEIQLMTGDNFNMIALQTLTTGLDGTTTTSFSAPAPDVTPNAAIYFLQFSNAGNMTDLTWTTRFTIAAADGSTTQPTNSTTYNGSSTPISWGTGSLVDSSNSTTSSNSTDSASSASSASGMMSASTQSAQAAASTATGLTVYTSGMTSTDAAAAASSINAAAGSASASAKASTSGTSGAGKMGVSVGLGMMGLVGAGLMLF